LKEHDVILSVNGAAVESAAQLRRMIRETPAGRIVALGISRDGQPLTIKVQLADRRKSFAVSSNDRMFNFKMPSIPPMPDFDVPVSVVIVHSSLRSGLMVENLTPQLGEFFGVKNGNGVLVRSVEKGSRADKSGFRAGDVIVKVNDQPVHDTSDFTHALRAHSGGPTAVTVVREKKEQNLTLTLPEKKDSGSLFEESFELHDLSADAERQVSRFGEQMARIQPALEKMKQKSLLLKDLQQNLHDFQLKLQEQGDKCRQESTGEWAEI
jgi:serine protease Do